MAAAQSPPRCGPVADGGWSEDGQLAATGRRGTGGQEGTAAGDSREALGEVVAGSARLGAKEYSCLREHPSTSARGGAGVGGHWGGGDPKSAGHDWRGPRQGSLYGEVDESGDVRGEGRGVPQEAHV